MPSCRPSPTSAAASDSAGRGAPARRRATLPASSAPRESIASHGFTSSPVVALLAMIGALHEEQALHTHYNEHAPLGGRRNKVVSAAEAVRLVHDGDTVATGGFVGIGFAEEIAVALE